MHDLALYNILNDLKETYELEGIEMPYTVEDYKSEVAQELLEKMSPSERSDLLKKLSPDERVEGLSPEELEECLRRMRGTSDSNED